MSLSRRRFFQAMGGAASVLMAGRGADSQARGIRQYRPLGRTGLRVSDIALGSYGGIAPQVVLRALELGINYFDTAPDYRGNTVSEEVIGQVIKRLKVRERVAIATKMCEATHYPGHLRKGTPVRKILESVEGSLKRLQTDWIDVLLFHGLGELDDEDVDRVKDDNFWEAFQRLKEQGKVRFLGGGCHGPRQMVRIVEWMVDSGRFDVIQVSYNFFQGTQFNFRHEGLDRVIAKARQRGLGVITMKSRAGARPQDVASLQARQMDFEQACLRWVLSNPNVSCVLVAPSSVQGLEHLVAASGQTLSDADARLLQRYAEAFGDKRCRIGCGECLDACPYGVAIPTVLRYHTYYEAYGMLEQARGEYARLSEERRPGPCLTCPAPCLQACPYGLNIRRMLLAAREDLEPSSTA